MIIENFDKLGLSQVYQLRGRVGRSNRQGYCYLLKNTRSTKKGKQKQESIDKIEGIKSGGFQISMEDLKIRGAGEILGDRQHGTIETFGYDLYIKMLNEEIQKQKGTYKERIENVQIIINNRGSIPETYISGEERLSIYKRFAMLETFDELRELIKEVQDRFGKIIGEVEKFVKYIELKIIAKDNGISLIKEDKKEYELIFEKTISQEFSNMVSLEENESIDEETGEVVYIQKITIEKSKLNEYIETLKVDY
jgi:transcription-repair coupling factor (superfamily II helicase)